MGVFSGRNENGGHRLAMSSTGPPPLTPPREGEGEAGAVSLADDRAAIGDVEVGDHGRFSPAILIIACGSPKLYSFGRLPIIPDRNDAATTIRCPWLAVA